jgi:uncharacterized membrane protein
MIWLSIVSLTAGALLAHRFKIIVLVPATLLVALLAAGAGLAQSRGVWSIVLIIGAASVGLQAGYFTGMLIQYGLGFRLGRGSASFSHSASARDPVC